MNNKIICLISIVFFISGCFSSSMLQTAKPLDKGESQFALGLSGYVFEGEFGMAPDVNYRRGINSKSDFGIGYSMGLLGHFKADYKRLLYHSPENQSYFSSGIGLDVYMPDEFAYDGKLYGATLPLYFSFHKNEKVVPYFAQRFTFGFNDLRVFNYIDHDNVPDTRLDFDHSMFYSGAAGIKFGQKWVQYFFELSYSAAFNHYYNKYHYSDIDQGISYWHVDEGRDSWGNFQFSTGIFLRLNRK